MGREHRGGVGGGATACARWRAAVALLAIGVLGAGGLLTPGPAAGEVLGPGDEAGGRIVDGSPEAIVVVGRSGTVGSWQGSGGGGARWTCAYYGIDVPESPEGDTAPSVRDADGPVDPEAGGDYVLICRDVAGRVVHSILVAGYDPADPLSGVAAVPRARDEARRRLALRAPTPALNPPGEQLVGLPTWLWVDGPWEPTSATATVGAVSATVVARPVEVRWELGDGTTVTCGPGRRYDPRRAPDEQRSDCSHVYERASRTAPGGTFQVTATVVYEVAWVASTGAGGSLGPLGRRASVPVRVLEAQAVIR